MVTVKGRSAVNGPGVFAAGSVAAVPQLEDGQFRLWRVRVHDPVRGDAEPLVRGFLSGSGRSGRFWATGSR